MIAMSGLFKDIGLAGGALLLASNYEYDEFGIPTCG